MVINSRLDKTFGPQMAFSGWILMAFGILFVLDIMGIILIVVGFVLASFTDGVMIDTVNKRVKRYSGPFGLALPGRWQGLNEFAGLTVFPVKKKISVFSRSNRSNTYTEEYYMVFVVGKNRKPAFPLLKSTSKELAVEEMDKLAEALSWVVWSPNEQ